ncbi:hypothetical protein [Streptomyces sp. SudanB66_2053]
MAVLLPPPSQEAVALGGVLRLFNNSQVATGRAAFRSGCGDRAG